MTRTCKLYRNLYEIVHPSISRRNITEYQIVLDENVLPIQVFYPGVEVEIKTMILYLPGEMRDDSFYEELAKQMNSTVLLLEFLESDEEKRYEKTIHYIWDELKRYSIHDNLSFMADGIGCHILNEMDGFCLSKKVYLSPLFQLKKELKNSIVITNQEEKNAQNFYSFHGDFSHVMDEDGLAIRESIFSIARDFIFSDI